jgi:hypothetical protein
MAQADKKLKSFGFFGNKYEEAAELLEKAANNYKLGKVRRWRRVCCDMQVSVGPIVRTSLKQAESGTASV